MEILSFKRLLKELVKDLGEYKSPYEEPLAQY